MHIVKYVVGMLALTATAAGAIAALLANLGILPLLLQPPLPDGEVTVAVSATMSIDQQTYTGSSIWRVEARTVGVPWPNPGIRTRQKVLGDAIEFDIGNNILAFLHPQSISIMGCASRENPDVEYPAATLPLFQGPCRTQPVGGITFVTLSSDGVPAFTHFRIGYDGELSHEGAGEELSPEIEMIADSFAIPSLTLTATSEALPGGMVERFPWILDLPSLDDGLWQRGKTYTQYFTTDIPE